MSGKQNIGVINALIRITFGLTMLSWATAKLVKKPWKNSYIIIAFLSAMKVAEGIVKYCPMTDLVQNQVQQMNTNQNSDSTNKPDLKQMLDMFVPKQKDESSNGSKKSTQSNQSNHNQKNEHEQH